MDKWITGIQQNQRVDYTVNYEVNNFSCFMMHHKNNTNLQISHWKKIEMNTSLTHSHTDFYCLYLFFFMMPQNDVISPKCTKCSCTLTWSLGGGRDEIKTVELVIETTPANIDWKPRDKSNPGDCLIF